MQFSFKITVGTTEITLTEEAASHQDFVKKLSFYSSIPTKGPNGEDDLRFVHRTTSQGHEYYSIISDKANMEYKFGQSQKEPGTMYGKGWEEKYVGDENGAAQNGGLGAQNNVAQNNAPANNGLGNQLPAQQTPPAQNNAPANNGLGNQLPPQQNAAPAQNAPAAQNAPVNTGLGNQLPPQQNAAPAQNAPAANAGVNVPNQLNNVNNNTQQTPPPAQNNGAVNDVLAKYGIQQG